MNKLSAVEAEQREWQGVGPQREEMAAPEPKPRNIQIGDEVRLKGHPNGPVLWMTVTALGATDTVMCVWHDHHGNLLEKSLPVAALAPRSGVVPRVMEIFSE